MFQDLKDITTQLKDVVDPKLVEKEVATSWRDFWNFEITTDESGAKVTLGILFVALACFILGILISKFLSRRLMSGLSRRFEIAPNTLHMWSSLTFYISCLLVTLIALKIAHVPLTIFTLLGGALALGIGFGSKNLVNNFISGIIFMFEAPAKVGDFVEVDGYFGRVIDVGTRATQLELGLNRRAIVPNSNFLEKPIVNWGKAGSPVYMRIKVSVDYGSDLQEVEKILLAAPKGVPQVLDSLPFRVQLMDFADSGITLELLFPIQIYTPGEREIVTSDVRKKIERAFAQGNVTIPYPQLVLHRTTPAPANPPR